jgi:hypothetical protein
MRASAFVRIIASIAGVAAATAAHSYCHEIKPEAPAAQAVALGIGVPYAESTYRAFKGISAAAKIKIPFYICRLPEPNAVVVDYAGKRSILVTTSLIDLARGDADELAAVFGHEFGHLMHRHMDKKRDQVVRTLRTAQRQAGRMVRGGADVNEAIEAAKDLFKDRVTEFSRTAEREADDQGFALTQVAGFDPSGARRFFERMEKLQGAEQKGWFATHPGWKERAVYSTRLETNESFRRLAELHRKDPAELRRIVAEWERAMPGSGAAAYYRGWVLAQSNQAPAAVATALEDAVLNFDGDGLSAAGQSHQAERSEATLALCVALYKEGRKQNALACARRLYPDEVDEFKKLTGWENIILVGPRQEKRGALYGARTEGTVTLMNCKRDAEGAGLQPVRSWKGMRPARPGAPQPVEAQACSPDMCNCEDIDLAERYPNLFRK